MQIDDEWLWSQLSKSSPVVPFMVFRCWAFPGHTALLPSNSSSSQFSISGHFQTSLEHGFARRSNHATQLHGLVIWCYSGMSRSVFTNVNSLSLVIPFMCLNARVSPSKFSCLVNLVSTSPKLVDDCPRFHYSTILSSYLMDYLEPRSLYMLRAERIGRIPYFLPTHPTNWSFNTTFPAYTNFTLLHITWHYHTPIFLYDYL